MLVAIASDLYGSCGGLGCYRQRQEALESVDLPQQSAHLLHVIRFEPRGCLEIALPGYLIPRVVVVHSNLAARAAHGGTLAGVHHGSLELRQTAAMRGDAVEQNIAVQVALRDGSRDRHRRSHAEACSA